jgi:hypothetical protein
MPEQAATPAPGPDTPFEIGLVMAGAISAGAYTAGVIDFLIQALDEWEEAKRFARAHPDDPAARECPVHEVRIKVMAGSSAGGMTAGLAAGLLGMKFESVTAQPPPERRAEPWNNTLYRSWVNTIDIDPLLGAKDLDGGGDLPVQSVLDSTILRDIARDAFLFERPGERAERPYVSDPLHVLLTVTNLRGVPYAPSFENWPKALPYEMTMHADHMHFVVSRNRPADGGAFWLNPDTFESPETWGVLKDAALATGAFPVGLAPQLLRRSPAQYASRQWAMPGPHEEGGRHYCEYWKNIPPNWPAGDKTAQGIASEGSPSYEFLCVDGGVMNNEPLDLARRILTGPGGTEAAEGERATRAVLMVMPFPNGATFSAEYDGRTGLLKLLTTTFNALISQARFKPQELALANDPEVYSRFLVVPRRGFQADGSLVPHTIACGSLGGFGGFLSRRFREHDYQLGRRNCQWFLKQYFALPSEGEHANRLFDRWTPEARKKHRILRAGRGGLKDGKEVVIPKLPVIPLVGAAAPDVPEPTWPTLSEAEFAALKPKIESRLGRVVTALIDQNVSGLFWGPLARGALKSAWWFRKGSTVDSVMKTVRADLEGRGLMTRQ